MAAKNLDPRFDPAFQRGYAASSDGDGDGATRSGATRPGATQAASTHVASGAEAYRNAATGYGQAESTNPSQASFASAAPRENAETPHPPAPQSHYVEHDGSLAEIGSGATHVSLARNPWLYVLWALAGALVAIGVFGLWWGISGLYVRGGLDEDTWMMFNLVQTAAPLIIMAGSFCMTAALLVHALNWMRRNP